MGRVVIRPKARRELIEVFVYLAEHASLDTARRFRQAATETFQELVRTPGMGSPSKVRSPKYAGVRMWRVKGFERYLVFYTAEPNRITVERIVHAGQDYRRLLQ